MAATSILEAVMADKRKYRSAKIDDEVISKAEVVVSAMALDGKRTNVAEYLSSILKAAVSKDFDKAVVKLREHSDRRSTT